jgi:hypothetical protein
MGESAIQGVFPHAPAMISGTRPTCRAGATLSLSRTL